MGMDVGKAELLKPVEEEGVMGAGSVEEMVEEEFGAEIMPGSEVKPEFDWKLV